MGRLLAHLGSEHWQSGKRRITWIVGGLSYGLQFVGEPCVQLQAPAGKKQADISM